MKHALSPARCLTTRSRPSPSSSTFLVIEPNAGRLYRGPGSDLRTIALADGQLLVVWLVLDSQQRVDVLRLLWLGDSIL
jgi:hypothetical protein